MAREEKQGWAGECHEDRSLLEQEVITTLPPSPSPWVRYFRILERNGHLAYYTSDKEASVNPSESIDLRLAGDISAREV